MIKSNSDKHLTYFKVENFKCFDSIELEDIGSINIITGDNNIGKSSLLEALLFDDDISVFNEDLGLLLMNKGFYFKAQKDLNLVERNTKSVTLRNNNVKHFINTNTKKNELHFYFKTIGFEDTLLKQDINIYQNQLPDELANVRNLKKVYTTDYNVITSQANYELSFPPDTDIIPFLSDQILYEDLVDFYENTIQKDFSIKTKFIEYLKEFVPGAINIEIRTAKDEFKDPHLVVYTDKSSFPIPLNQYGQGTVKMLKIFMAIISFSGHRLMLDEIDNGIHFSRQKDYFRRIISLAKENNTQLFITTHSLECIKYIKESLEEADSIEIQNDFRLFSLNKNKENQIKAYKYSFNNLELAIESKINIRGGK